MKHLIIDYISKYMVLSEEEKKAILEIDTLRTYKKGTILLEEGQLSEEEYFVLKGCLRCYYIVDGDEKSTAFYTEYQSLNPMCSINGRPSEYYVACVEDCILSVGNAGMESDMLEKFPRFEKLCRIISEELLAQNQASFDDFRISSPEERYLNLLQRRPDLLQRVPQYQMASYLGITPQSLSRMRKRIVMKEKVHA